MRSLFANIYYLYLIKLSKWLMLIMPVVVLFYNDNGLESYQIYLLQAGYSISVVIFEIHLGIWPISSAALRWNTQSSSLALCWQQDRLLQPPLCSVTRVSPSPISKMVKFLEVDPEQPIGDVTERDSRML